MVMRTLFFLAGFLWASQAPAATPLEDGILLEMNLARVKPAVYASHLQKLRGTFRGKYMVRGNARIATTEGVRAVDEAIAFLRRQKPLPPLRGSAGLAAAAAELVAEQGRSGETGHKGKSAGGTKERVERRGVWSGSIGENISYGSSQPRDVVMQLIIDDGVPGRVHRKNIFGRGFREAGVACGPHPTFRTVCVTDFAGGFSTR